MVKRSHTAAPIVDAEVQQQQQEQQNNPQDISDAYAQQQLEQQAYGNIPSVQFQKNQSEIIKLLKIDDLTEFGLRLKGLGVNWETQQIEQQGQPLINAGGVELFLGIVRGACNNIVTMCTLKPEKISDCFYQQSQSIQDFIYYNYKKYGVEKQNFDIIFNQARMLILAALNRTSSDSISDKQFLMTTERSIETRNIMNGGMGNGTNGSMPPRRGGIGGLGKFLSFVRGGEEQ